MSAWSFYKKREREREANGGEMMTNYYLEIELESHRSGRKLTTHVKLALGPGPRVTKKGNSIKLQGDAHPGGESSITLRGNKTIRYKAAGYGTNGRKDGNTVKFATVAAYDELKAHLERLERVVDKAQQARQDEFTLPEKSYGRFHLPLGESEEIEVPFTNNAAGGGRRRSTRRRSTRRRSTRRRRV